TDFALARALRAADVDAARARLLALSAKKAYETIPALALKAKKVAAWLAEADRKTPPAEGRLRSPGPRKGRDIEGAQLVEDAWRDERFGRFAEGPPPR